MRARWKGLEHLVLSFERTGAIDDARIPHQGPERVLNRRHVGIVGLDDADHLIARQCQNHVTEIVSQLEHVGPAPVPRHRAIDRWMMTYAHLVPTFHRSEGWPGWCTLTRYAASMPDLHTSANARSSTYDKYANCA